jgi:peptide-methionine (S)-S-oxide reductase
MIGHNTLEESTLAGGCFWCTQAVFTRLKGIESVVAGYAGGDFKNPTYDDIHTHQTGHAEAIQLLFNPKIIPYAKILDVFWATHDPTTLNRQGNDVGNEYRSIIFYHNQKQKETALDSKQRLEQKGIYTAPIVTEIIAYKNFYPAKNTHQNFYESNKEYPYCRIIIDPKIQKLMRDYNDLIKKDV